ncbi:MAG: MarP family serine protease [Candidatus Dormibacteria bacterium]
MDILDVILVALVALLAYSGYRRGLTWGGLSAIGLIVGSVTGALLAPPVTQWLASGRGNSARPLVAAGVFLGSVLIIQGIGTAVGFRLRTRTVRGRFRRWDSIAGSVAGGFGVIFTAWFLAFVFVDGQTPWVSQQVRDSAIERALATVGPTQPPLAANVRRFLSDQVTPFASFNRSDLAPQPIPAEQRTPGVQRAYGAVSRVIASSSNSQCSGSEAGSAWPLTADHLVTNAHVVAGSDHIEVDIPDGRTLTAHLVLFDSDVDIAILEVPGAALSPLPLAPDPATVAQPAAGIGYPQGGAETLYPAAVRGVEDARGYNIYYENSRLTRNIVVISARVIPGDSGGPLLDLSGRVIGLTFGSSPNQDDAVGYALSVAEITPALQQGRSSNTEVSSGRCPQG